jgi:hypothetical protein
MRRNIRFPCRKRKPKFLVQSRRNDVFRDQDPNLRTGTGYSAATIHPHLGAAN